MVGSDPKTSAYQTLQHDRLCEAVDEVPRGLKVWRSPLPSSSTRRLRGRRGERGSTQALKDRALSRPYSNRKSSRRNRRISQPL